MPVADYHKLVSTTVTGDVKSVITFIKLGESEWTVSVLLYHRENELLSRSFTSNKEERVTAFISAMAVECDEVLKAQASTE